MTKQQYRFKQEYFHIDGKYNVLGLIICSGNGYNFETYCCKNCGEIFVVDLELLYHRKVTIENLVNEKNCPKCSKNLNMFLVKYPENIFYENNLLKNCNFIDNVDFENTFLVEVYKLA